LVGTCFVPHVPRSDAARVGRGAFANLGRTAHCRAHRSGRRFDPLGERPTIDLLAWFTEDERQDCTTCGERACVTLPDALASFCLACGAITIDGVEIEWSSDVVLAHAKSNAA